jgi:D-amino-acid dehydrogenase
MRNKTDTAQGPPDAADVVVIGGGIVGLSCAHFLQLHGRQPIVVEQGQVGRGSSHGNAGLVAPSHSIPLPAPGVVLQALRWLLDPASPFVIRARLDPALARWLIRFAWSARREPMLRAISTLRDLNRLSAELYVELARDAEAALAYHPTGVLNVYGTSRAFAHGRREADLLTRYGVTSEILESGDLVGAEPGLRPGLAGGVLWPEDGYVDPAAFVGALHKDLRRRGVRVLADTEVLEISQNHQHVSVTTTAGIVRCEEAVVAAGAWSAALLRRLGQRVRVEPAKGYSITVEQAASRLRRPLLLAEAKVAVTPLNGSLRLAGTLELAGLDASIDARRLDAVRRAADPYLRDGARGGRETVWRGLRPLSADGLPLIGRLPTQSRIAVATGHGHIGVSLAPATGKLIAELLTGQPPTLDLRPLKPVR